MRLVRIARLLSSSASPKLSAMVLLICSSLSPLILSAQTTSDDDAHRSGVAKDVFQKASRYIVQIRTADHSVGSGVFVGDERDQFIVTNCHVVEDNDVVLVVIFDDTNNGTRMLSEVLAKDKKRDLCILSVIFGPEKIEFLDASKEISALSELSIGDDVYAIGNPRGVHLTISQGIISQLRDYFEDYDGPIIHTDAAIYYGNSGGGLFSNNGKLIGIPTFVYPGYDALSSAIPAKEIVGLFDEARQRRSCFRKPTYECLLVEAHRYAQEVWSWSQESSSRKEQSSDRKARLSVSARIARAQAEGFLDDTEAAFLIVPTEIELELDQLQWEQSDQDIRDSILVDLVMVFLAIEDIDGAKRVAQKIGNTADRGNAMFLVLGKEIESKDTSGISSTFEHLSGVARDITASNYFENLDWLLSARVLSLPSGLIYGVNYEEFYDIYEGLGEFSEVLHDRIKELTDEVRPEAAASERLLVPLVGSIVAQTMFDYGFEEAADKRLTEMRESIGKETGRVPADQLFDVWCYIFRISSCVEVGLNGLMTRPKLIIEHDYVRSFLLGKIAEMTITERCDIVGAIDATEHIDTSAARISALIEVAVAQAFTGDKGGARITFAAAKQAADNIIDDDRSTSLEFFRGYIENHGDVIRTLNEGSHKSLQSFLNRIAEAQVLAGDIEAALETVREGATDFDRADILISIAEALNSRDESLASSKLDACRERVE